MFQKLFWNLLLNMDSECFHRSYKRGDAYLIVLNMVTEDRTLHKQKRKKLVDEQIRRTGVGLRLLGEKIAVNVFL